MTTKPTTRAQQLLARSRGKAARPMPVPGLAHGARAKSADVAELDKALANRPKAPPHRHVFELGGCKVCGMLEVEST